MNSADTGILRALRGCEGNVTGAELAGLLQLTPEAIAVRIVELRQAGYEIEEHPHLGYRLISVPDRLIADDLVAMLEGSVLGSKILVFEKTDSTNDLVARLGREGADEGLVIFAEEQTAGRGRLGRRWESNAHLGLWFSVLLRPRFERNLWTRLTTWAAVAASDAIESETPCRAMIKWPNDVFIGGKKVAGILVESHFDRLRGNFAVLGIGVNVNHQAFPTELAEKACSLRMAAGHSCDRQKISVAILRRLDALYTQLEDHFETVLAAARRRDFLQGKWVQVSVGQELVKGMADRLDEQGALVLRLQDGRETTITSGEATLTFD
jgi:BirA family biotin operon repressor/biotin-[acetyl-CoA-carboxylase] ligase